MEQMTFSLFFQSLINGLNQGAIYALIALGYTMVYGIIRMINFAHGDFIMIGAYTLFYTILLMVNAGMPAWLSVIVAIAVCALVGVLVETFAYRPVRKAGPMSALITALAMSIFLENLAMVLFGAKPHNVQAIFSLSTITVGSVALPLNVLLTIAIGLGIMIALQLFVKKTKLGKAMRAVPQDKDASILVGINVNRIITTTFAIGSGLAAVAALMYCATYPRVTNDMGSMMGMKAFILKLSTFDRAFWIMVVCVTVMFLFVRSRFGRTVQAIRGDYIAASASGINVTYYKVLTFAVSAFFAGVGGSVYAHYMTAMIPTNFNFNYSAELLSEVIIGGTGSLTGSIIGAAFLSSLPELMRDFSTYRMLAYSVVLVLVMLFRPGGIFGRWEFSLTRLLDGIRHPKAKAAKGA